MDNLSITNNYSLTNSYFLSSTTNTYNGMLDEDINLSEILQEYQSLLSLSNDFEEKKRPSNIVAGSHLNNDYCYEEQDISHIRSDQTISRIGNIGHDNLHISRMSFHHMENLKNSIISERIDFTNVSSCPLNNGNDLKSLNNYYYYEKIENESCPTLINLSYEKYISNDSEYKQNYRITPDIIISEVSENSFVVDDDDNCNDIDELSKANSMNLLSVDNTLNFFTRRKKERYFLSPKKLIQKYKREENTKIKNLSLNDDSHCKKFETGLDEKKVLNNIQKLSSFCLEDITIEWSSFEEINEEDNEFSFKTSTPRDDEISFSQLLNDISPVKKEKENIESASYYRVSGKRYFSRKEGLNYFSTPIK